MGNGVVAILDASLSENIQHILELEGYQVIEATDTDSVFQWFKTKDQPDVVIIDHEPEVLDADLLLEMLSSNEVKVRSKIVVLGVECRLCDEIPCVCLPKPFDLKEFIRILRPSLLEARV